jgi:hypothetical protein
MAQIRYTNAFGLPGGFNITNNEPIDSRMYVKDINHIYLEENWATVKPYNGLIVSDPNGEVRVCINASEYQLESSWKNIGDSETILQIIEENEEVIAAAITNLDDRLLTSEETLNTLNEEIVKNEKVIATALTNLDTRVLDTKTKINTLNEETAQIRQTIIDNEKVIATSLNEIYNVIDNVAGLEEISYNDLINKRSAKRLVPGRLYRIIDYVTTTTEKNTVSAGHRFDIIVQALDKNILCEKALAVKNEDDTYFPNNTKFESWQLWYSLDNNMTRFPWADVFNGKGVIYRMIDERGNDCPYDFKNIMFQLSGRTYYTFDKEANDFSLELGCYNNIIKPYVNGLNCNIILGPKSNNNFIGNNSHHNVLPTMSQNIRIDNNVSYIMLLGETTVKDAHKNYHIMSGVGNDDNNYTYIDITPDLEYVTKVGVNSSGIVKQWCEADLIL